MSYAPWIGGLTVLEYIKKREFNAYLKMF